MMNYLLFGATSCLFIYFFFLRRHKKQRKFQICTPKNFNFNYETKTLKVPPLHGFLLKIGCKLANSLFGNLFLVEHLISEGNIDIFRSKKLSDLPTFYPNATFEEEPAKPGVNCFSDADVDNLLLSNFDKDELDSFSFYTMSSYLTRYKNKTLTPSQVAQRVLVAIKEISQLRAVVKYNPEEICKMADESTERYKSNTTLSPVDGIFVIIKDEFAVKGFIYSNGTSFLGREGPSTFDSGLVEKLKSLGVVIVGIANMHELGLGTSGNNSNKGFGTCRNPYDVNYYTGGSSSGCAAAVASGLCCLGLGTDGGGSVRIPSGYCGVVGLKPTYARLNLVNTDCLGNTVGHAGPICTNVRDTAVFYALLAGPHPEFPPGLLQPQITLTDFSGDLTGMKIGIDRRYFKDCTEDVFEICDKSLSYLLKCGATVVDIEIPELREVMLAHRIIILSEMTTGMNHGFDVNYEDLTLVTRIMFKLGNSLTASDYIQACKQRTRINCYLKQAFENIDAIVTPTTGHCAPKINPSELSLGGMNGEQDVLNMRYAGLGNLTGCPAISIPVGYNASGLPVGLQFMSAWWKENTVLKIAECVERHVPKMKPKVFSDLLEN